MKGLVNEFQSRAKVSTRLVVQVSGKKMGSRLCVAIFTAKLWPGKTDGQTGL